jgi:PPOX class probable F420-dependent enzyme
MSDILNDVPESHRDLLRRTLTATLTTIDAKGRPRSRAVWYFVDSDGQLKGSTTSNRRQYKDLRRNRNCDLFIIDFEDPLRTLEVRATAELIADPDNGTVRKLANVYGLDAAKVPAKEDRYTVTYRPRRLVAGRYGLEGILFGPGAEEQSHPH